MVKKYKKLSKEKLNKLKKKAIRENRPIVIGRGKQSKSGISGYSKSRDKKLKALPAGKRISKNGNIYYEYRKNRSDMFLRRI